MWTCIRGSSTAAGRVPNSHCTQVTHANPPSPGRATHNPRHCCMQLTLCHHRSSRRRLHLCQVCALNPCKVSATSKAQHAGPHCRFLMYARFRLSTCCRKSDMDVSMFIVRASLIQNLGPADTIMGHQLFVAIAARGPAPSCMHGLHWHGYRPSSTHHSWLPAGTAAVTTAVPASGQRCRPPTQDHPSCMHALGSNRSIDTNSIYPVIHACLLCMRPLTWSTPHTHAVVARQALAAGAAALIRNARGRRHRLVRARRQADTVPAHAATARGPRARVQRCVCAPCVQAPHRPAPQVAWPPLPDSCMVPRRAGHVVSNSACCLGNGHATRVRAPTSTDPRRRVTRPLGAAPCEHHQLMHGRAASTRMTTQHMLPDTETTYPGSLEHAPAS